MASDLLMSCLAAGIERLQLFAGEPDSNDLHRLGPSVTTCLSYDEIGMHSRVTESRSRCGTLRVPIGL